MQFPGQIKKMDTKFVVSQKGTNYNLQQYILSIYQGELILKETISMARWF